MRVQLFVTATLALLVAMPDISRAEQGQCPDVPRELVTFKYIDYNSDSTALRLWFPKKFEKAKLFQVFVAYGEGKDAIGFEARVEESGRNYLSVIHLPRTHGKLVVRAQYGEKSCYRLLEATFQGGSRLR